jgi:UDP-glucose 4-epimerase
MNKIMKNESLPIFGDGKQKRAFTHIGDIAPVIASSIHNKKAYNQVFNIGADIPFSVNELAKVVSQSMGVKPKVEYHPPRKEVKNAYADHGKAVKVFKHKPKIDLKDGIARMSLWAKEHGAKQSKKFKNIEVERNLPPSWKT